MIKQVQHQSLNQNLSPQQIMLMKLLQVPTMDLNVRIEDELIENPALELTDPFERDEDPLKLEDNSTKEAEEERSEGTDYESIDSSLDLGDLTQEDDYYGHYNNESDDQTDGNYRFKVENTFQDHLTRQLDLLNLNDQEIAIGMQIIGSIDSDGYLRRDVHALKNDLYFGSNLVVEESTIQNVLDKIKQFDPPGIASSNLQECLITQLEQNELSHTNLYKNSITILRKYFDLFVKKQFNKIQQRLKIDQNELKESVDLITSLNPRPGSSFSSGESQKPSYIIPDFFVHFNGTDFDITLNSRNAPHLRISKEFKTIMESVTDGAELNKSQKDALTFAKHKIESAQWFIDSIKQRQNTLFNTMTAIVSLQKEFFKTGDDVDLKPMILKDVSDIVNLDLSTISRVVNQKYVDTEFGIFKLKYFFSEGITNDEGEEISNMKIKSYLRTMIENEDKSKPLSDLQLLDMLHNEGFKLARRTVSKYREQLNIPVSRLRKEL